jgi:hypothetical protein
MHTQQKMKLKKNTKLFLDPTKIDLSLKERIPTPTGWRVLVMPWAGPEKNRWRYYSD